MVWQLGKKDEVVKKVMLIGVEGSRGKYKLKKYRVYVIREL